MNLIGQFLLVGSLGCLLELRGLLLFLKLENLLISAAIANKSCGAYLRAAFITIFLKNATLKQVHRRQKLTTDFFKLLELTILVVTISISRKKYAYHGFRGGSFSKWLDNKIIGFLHI